MWLLLLLVPSAVLSASVDLCEPARKVGINITTFSKNVAHLVHSLSVEDIRYFFDDQFPVDNKVPTVNFDLTGPPVLMYAPSRPSEFKFPAGAAVDYILSNNDDTFKFGSIGSGATTLEEIVHHMHMLEMWNMASKEYREIESNGVDTQNVCPCLVNNEKENEIIDHLTFIFDSSQDWMPYKIADGERRIPKRKGKAMSLCPVYWDPPAIDNNNSDPEDKEREGRYIKGEKYTVVNGEEYQIVPELKDSKSWNYWKSRSIKEVKQDDPKMFSFAMYMYCKLNYA